MATAHADTLIARNPATDAELARIPSTSPGDVLLQVAAARHAGESWCVVPIRERIAVVRRFWKILSRDAEMLARAIRDEIGKPFPEAQFEVVATLDALRWTVKSARRVLADQKVGPGWQRAAMVGTAVVRWKPLGVVGIIGTWNYPLLLDVPTIAQALAAGNSVAWKPSERCPFVASLVRARLEEAGVPEDLVATLFGGRDVASALMDTDQLAKLWFTGGVETGRKLFATMAAKLVPCVMELSGFDPAIVRSDAPRESTVKALTWAAFVGAGQTCVAVKRIYVVGDARPFAEAIAQEARKLRVGDPSGDVDIGPMISRTARNTFHATIRDAVAAGAEVLCGGSPIDGPGSYYPPTVLLDPETGAESSLEGVFGPVVVVSGVDSDDHAVALANCGEYGLGASVWGRDLRQCRAIADRLDAGMITINDAVTPSGHAGSPFGGIKSSGFGRTRGKLGLREFVQPQTLQERKPGGFRPHLFPYSSGLGKILALYRRLFH